MRPDSSAAAPSTNGIVVLARPESRAGGWISIPRSTSSGFSPTPSAKSNALSSNGEARNADATRNAASTAPQAAVACAAAHGMRGTVISTNAAMNSDIIQVQNSSDPAWLPYSAAHFICGSMAPEETEATYASEKSSVSRAVASMATAAVVNSAVTTIARRPARSSGALARRWPYADAPAAKVEVASAVSSAAAPAVASTFMTARS